MQPGERIGKYVVESQLGEGGNGAVFAARDAILGRRVALKILHPEMLHDATIAARFRQEAQAMAQLSHPNVVIVHDFVSDETRWALVMELIENGETLSSLIKRSGRLPVARALRLVSQTASALGHAHRRGIVHRDVKPANVMVVHGEHGEVAKLTDFGIARIIHGERRTQAALTLGTLWYLAPEQAQNSAVDARADVYALGCSLYEALSGRVPFPYDNVARVLASHVSEPPRPLSEVVPGIPADVDALVARCLAKNPYDRPRDGEELRVLIDDVLARLEPPRSPQSVPHGSMPPRGSPAPGSPHVGSPTPSPSYPTPGHASYPTPAPGYPNPAPGYPTPAPGYPNAAPGYPTPAPGYAPQPTPAPRPADLLTGFVAQPSAHAVVAPTQAMPAMGQNAGASVASPPPAPLSPALQAAQQAENARDRRLGLYIGSGAVTLVVLTCGFGMLLCILTGVFRCG